MPGHVPVRFALLDFTRGFRRFAPVRVYRRNSMDKILMHLRSRTFEFLSLSHLLKFAVDTTGGTRVDRFTDCDTYGV